MKNNKIYQILNKEYGDVKTSLNYSNDLELLIAVILSAQCTDLVVNKVTPILFSKFKTIDDFSNAKLLEIEKIIRPTGFYKNKAKNIKECCIKIRKDFNKKIPVKLSDMILLPGVGRKTANVVLNELFNLNEGVAVDTHVLRVSRRLGLTKSQNPLKVEQDLINYFKKEYRRNISLYFIYHGRRICTAKKAYCNNCVLSKNCISCKKIKRIY